MAWLQFFFLGYGLPFTVYVVFQFGAILMLVGRWRIAVSLPAPFMAMLLMDSLIAKDSHLNLWPVWLIVISPLAVIYVLLVWIGGIASRLRTLGRDPSVLGDGTRDAS